VGTDKGIWRRPASQVVAVDPTFELASAVKLHQNYPNPFNPTTTIRYDLPKPTLVRLSVYDILGREVAVLVNRGINAGAYEVKFDAMGLASGMYFYRLTAGSFVQTRKMLVVK